MADAVMRMMEPEVQRQVEPEDEELQAKATSGRISEVNSNLESHIQSLKGGGKPLPESERAYLIRNTPQLCCDWVCRRNV